MKNRRNIVEQKYPPENPNDIWLKDGKFYHSTSEGWTVIDSEIEYTSKTSMIADKPKGGTIGINKETGEASIYNDVAKQWSPLGGGVTAISWQELKDKRDASELIPGSLYRITDYQCTTTQKNTQSAGHQFDIVLLALSENKLAEEGWAMMHDNIYDVTFVDGITKKCYLYEYNTNDGEWNIVDVDTLTGITGRYAGEGEDIIINESNKTATCADSSTDLTEPNLPYNYFQNSNLSAWKVWYCLDNDTSRFAWADDSVDSGSPAYILVTRDGFSDAYFRNPSEDLFQQGNHFKSWKSGGQTIIHTTVEEPDTSTPIYRVSIVEGMVIDNKAEVLSYTPAHEGTGLPNGRGVIYHLIDEWNNDVPYDFKNIMLSVEMGKDEYGYLFSRSNYIGDGDYSINGAFVNVSIAQYPTYTGDKGGFINSIELGILAPSLRAGERLQDIKIASGYLTSNGQIDQLSSHSIIGYSIEFSKT